MAPQKETFMVLSVDLECNRCYTKVKRTLCSFPQVQDQIYKEKENKVLIKVVCCSPEKIMDKIFAKGGKSIKDIEILKPKPPADNKPKDAPPPADKPKQAPPPADKPKQAPPADNKPKDAPPADKPKQAPPADSKPKDAPPAAAKPPPADDKPPKKNVTFKPDGQPAPAKPQGDGAAKPKEGPPAAAAPKPADQQAAMMAPMVPASVYGYGYPVNVGCLDCYEGRMCGYHSNGAGYGYGYGYGAPPPPPAAGGYGYGYGVPAPPPPAYGYKPGYCVSRYGDYVSDENASGCVVM